MAKNYVEGLFEYIKNSPSPYHAVDTAKKMLNEAGFTEVLETETWNLKAGGNYYVTRSDSAIIAFQIPEKEAKGFHMVASHDDSPCFKLKENPELTQTILVVVGAIGTLLAVAGPIIALIGTLTVAVAAFNIATLPVIGTIALVVAAITALIAIGALLIANWDEIKAACKTFIQTFLMKMPVVGKLLISKEMSMFARTFASLQKNNVLLTDSIDILAKITSNEIYKELELRTIDNLIKGNKMSETFKDHWAIPDVAYFMIVTGESTGELAEMLERVAEFYSKEEKSSVAMIKTFIEPVMIISLAIVVGFILMAVLIPMFGIYGTVA
jgi:type II secretory pathway component PulF